MEDILLLPKAVTGADRKISTDFGGSKLSDEVIVYDSCIEKLISEGGENFFKYISGLGIADEPNMMILSSRHLNYYEYSDLKGVNTLINVRKFNRMKHLDSFLVIVRRAISPDTNFIGCFSDNDTQTATILMKKNGLRINNYLDSSNEIQFNKDDITQLLESHGFKICDMTEIRGMTYFMTQVNVKSVA
jgi:hypothetical protein